MTEVTSRVPGVRGGRRCQPVTRALVSKGRTRRGELSNLVDGCFQAAGFSCITPSMKITPLITSGSSLDPFKARHPFEADSISLYTIVRHADRLPLPFVLACRSRTVENTLSI